MQQPLSFFFAAAITISGLTALTGCSQPSSPWSTVRAVRVDTRDADDPSARYAEHVSGVLKTANVEHKIVTYEYRYRTALREEAIGTRTAVLYRDDRNPNNPWWLTDERLFKPVWVPGEDENRQVSFYLHRPASVVSTRVIGDGEGKRIIGAPGTPTPAERMVARLDPVKKTERSRNWFGRPTGPQAETRLIASAVRKPAAIRANRLRPASALLNGDLRYAALFRARHGTAFDRASTTDRRKMEDLLLTNGRRSALLF